MSKISLFKIKSSLVKIVFVFLSYFLIFVFSQNVKAADWVSTVIDENGDVGGTTSLAIDSNNKVHIAYYDFTNEDLKYVTNASGAWQTEIVQSAGNVGEYPSLALNSNNDIYISYFDETNTKIKLANKNANSSSWTITAIDPAELQGGESSLAIDSNDKIHIAYKNYTSSINILKYANNASGSFSTFLIDNSNNVSGRISLALNSNNQPSISYYKNSDLWLASSYSFNSSWSITAIDNNDDNVGDESFLRFDSNDKAHIIYYDWSNTALKYATNSSGLWQKEIIDNSADVGFYNSFAIDSNNNIHISYYDFGNKRLKYARKILSKNNWEIFVLDDSGDATGIYTSLAIDSYNRINISYYNIDNGDLKYIYTPGPSFFSLLINSEDEEFTDTPEVTLVFSVSGGPTQVLISESRNFSGASWETYAVSRKFILSSGDGVKTVYAKSRDEWYAESEIASDEIILETTKSEITTTPKKSKITKFVTKSPKQREELLKKNKVYKIYDLKFSFLKFPQKLKKTKYFFEIKRPKKYSPKYKNAKKLTLKKYWILETNFYKYKAKTKKDKFRIRYIFKYSDDELKKLKENQLVLKYYNPKIKKWQRLSAKHNKKKNTFTIIFDRFLFPINYFVIGKNN